MLRNVFNSQPLPKVLTVDLGREVYSGNILSVSRLLAKEIDENLKRGEQTILFMNRRGHSSYIACPKCKYVYRCPNCGISLTFHRNDGKLHCHYCNYKEDLPFFLAASAARKPFVTAEQGLKKSKNSCFLFFRALKYFEWTLTAFPAK